MHCNKTGKNHPELSARRKGGWFLFYNQESWCMYIKRICQIFDSGLRLGILKSSHQTTSPLRPSQLTQTIKQNHWVILNDAWPISESWNGRIWTGFVKTLHPLLDMSWSLSSASCNMLVHFMFLGTKEVCFSCTMFLHAVLLHVACFEDHRCSR